MSAASLTNVAWLKQGPVARVLDVLDRDGEEARVVGGAVRNALLGEPVREFDVATTAAPPEVMRRLEAAGLKAVPTGIDHGTVTAVVDGAGVEITTLREDVETFGRKANVAFARDWRGDAQRRDFTINALSVSRDGTVHDYVGGLADLQQRHVRFIGDPAARITEDYLRILRFFRFYAAYGEGLPDAAALHACIAARDGLQTLSRERIRMEMLKLLAAPRHPIPALVALAESGLLLSILGGVPSLASVSNMIKLEDATGLPADPVRRLGALAVIVVEDADRLMERLRLSNAEYERLRSIGDRWWRVSPQGEGARVLLYRLGRERALDRALIAWSRAWVTDHDALWEDFLSGLRGVDIPIFPLSAEDFIRRGVAKGPQLGAVLRAAEAAWIAGAFPQNPSALASIADEAVRSLASGADQA